MNKDKLIYQLFIGKVSEIIGDDKTLELLKDSRDAFDVELHEDNPNDDLPEFEHDDPIIKGQ